jgi:hypothetical protein
MVRNMGMPNDTFKSADEHAKFYFSTIVNHLLKEPSCDPLSDTFEVCFLGLIRKFTLSAYATLAQNEEEKTQQFLALISLFSAHVALKDKEMAHQTFEIIKEALDVFFGRE